MKKIFFAPLQGFTEAPYRNAHAAIFGEVDAYYTPFVRLEKGDVFRNKDIRDVLPENNRVPLLVPQLLASTPDEFVPIAEKLVELGHKEIDINMGCPFPMLAKKHKGAGILPYPEEATQLLEVMKRFPNVEFSLKMRLGWASADESMALVEILNDLPLKRIIMHARLGNQQYKGSCDREAFARFAEAINKPLMYNGDLTTVEDIHQIVTQFPQLEGVMIGRGLLTNPALAMEYKLGRMLTRRELAEKINLLHQEVFTYYVDFLQGDTQLLNKMKTFWEYLAPQLEKKAFKSLSKCSKMSKYSLLVREALVSIR